MTTKMIRLNKDLYKEMSFDEILKMYNELIWSYIINFQAKFRFMMFDNEDLYQEFSMALYKCYNQYDIEKGVGFGLVAKKYLTHKSMNISRKASMDKRKNRASRESDIELFIKYRGKESVESEYNKRIIIDYIKSLNGRDKLIMVTKSKGLYRGEVAKKLGYSRQWVNHIVRKHEKLIRQELLDKVVV